MNVLLLVVDSLRTASLTTTTGRASEHAVPRPSRPAHGELPPRLRRRVLDAGALPTERTDLRKCAAANRPLPGSRPAGEGRPAPPIGRPAPSSPTPEAGLQPRAKRACVDPQTCSRLARRLRPATQNGNGSPRPRTQLVVAAAGRPRASGGQPPHSKVSSTSLPPVGAGACSRCASGRAATRRPDYWPLCDRCAMPPRRKSGISRALTLQLALLAASGR